MKCTLSLPALFCLVIGTGTLSAQLPAKVTGTVTDASKKPVVAATVSLLKAKDSMLIKTTLTGETGIFELEHLSADTFLITITAIGFVKYSSPPIIISVQSPSVILPAISLQRLDAGMLQEVTVTGKRPFIERQIDRTVMNVDALISNAGTTALEVLEKAPGVLVDNEGNISLRGKSGVLILIDDKPTYLSGASLAGYLKSLSSDQLDKIEIMTNPPAKYDAAGNAGVINIKTKKIKKKGFNGNLNTTFGQGAYWRSNNSLNLNYRRNDLNVFGNFGWNKDNGFNDLMIERRYKNPDGSIKSSFLQNSFIRRINHSYSGKLGMDYSINKKTTVGFVFNGVRNTSIQKINNTSQLRNAAQALDSIITANNDQQELFRSGSINLNYRHQYDSTGRELTMDADYVNYSIHSDQLFRNGSFYANNTVKSRDTLSGALPSGINIYSFKADYTYPLKGKASLAGGIKTSYIKTDNIAGYFSIVNNAELPDYEKSNHFLYNEHINAAYINFKKEYKKIGMQFGLRAEHTLSEGHQLGNSVKPDSAFKRNYTNLFPTVYFSYKPDTGNRHQFVLSYGKRINRPYFKDLNPFVMPLDKFTNYLGNPFLTPMFSHNFSLSHTYKNVMTTTAFFNYTKDAIAETIELQGAKFISRPNNIGQGKEMGFSTDFTLHPTKWWTSIWFGEVQFRHYKGPLYTTFLDTSAFFGIAHVTNQFQFKKGWSFEVFGLYVGKRLARQFVLGEFWAVNIGAQKKILKDKGSLKLNVPDLFYSRVNKGIINNLQNGEGNYHNMGDSRQVRLTFSYSFGKSGDSPRKRGTGAESEQSRVQ